LRPTCVTGLNIWGSGASDYDTYTNKRRCESTSPVSRFGTNLVRLFTRRWKRPLCSTKLTLIESARTRVLKDYANNVGVHYNWACEDYRLICDWWPRPSLSSFFTDSTPYSEFDRRPAARQSPTYKKTEIPITVNGCSILPVLRLDQNDD
jgi:hypothetical protein